jgi:hypothetical protein
MAQAPVFKSATMTIGCVLSVPAADNQFANRTLPKSGLLLIFDA